MKCFEKIKVSFLMTKIMAGTINFTAPDAKITDG